MAQEPLVTIKHGQLQGTIKSDWKGKSYYSFQGIPYGKPPVGKLRFKAPRPADPWTGIRDATVEGSECFSRDLFKNTSGSEDCLFLNVYTPELPTSRSNLKPVMVWIHGGGFISGSGNSDLYGPDFLISEEVIIVTINYRLGLLGFACFDEPSLEIPGNAGLKDQVLALKWVQENIKSFCGDPQNVTIFGESAGGACVHYLMLSPLARGLFHKAIAQSGVATNLWARGQRSAPLISKALNLTTENEDEIVNIIEKMPIEKLFELQESIPDPFKVCCVPPIGPVIERKSNEPAFLLEDPVNLLKTGRFNQVPLLIGFTSREGMLLENKCKEEHGEIRWPTDFEELVPFDLNFPKGTTNSKIVAQQIRRFYYGTEEPSYKNITQYYSVQTDTCFFIAINNAIRYQAASSSAPIYYYRMAVDTELNFYKILANITTPGTCHADDLGYIFKNIFTPEIRDDSPEELAVRRIIRLWSTFAKTGNPNYHTSLIGVTWPPVEQNKLNFLEIGENLTVGVDPHTERVKFWDTIYRLSSVSSKL